MPITKHNYIVKDVNILADTLRKAFTIARSGRPGPVLVDITKDVTANTCEYEKKAPEKAEKPGRYTEEELVSSDIIGMKYGEREKAFYLCGRRRGDLRGIRGSADVCESCGRAGL